MNFSRPRWPAVLMTCSLLFCSALLTPLAAEDAPQYGPRLPTEPPSPEPIRGFEPDGKFELWLQDKRAQGAVISVSRRGGNLHLIQSDELSNPLLIVPQQRGVSGVQASEITEELDGSLSIPGTPRQVFQRFEMVKGGLQFQLAGIRIELRKAEHQLGLKLAEELLARNPAYSFGRNHYSPDAETLKRIRSLGEGVSVRTFFGTWCPACSQRIPRLFRVKKDLGEEPVEFEFYGLPSPFHDEPQAKSLEIKSVPTSVIFRNGTEIGRIKGDDWTTPEAKLAEVLETHPK